MSTVPSPHSLTCSENQSTRVLVLSFASGSAAPCFEGIGRRTRSNKDENLGAG